MTSSTKIQIVLFSGGNGTKSITEAFLRHPQIRLSIVINAYDDGHSTGRLRRFIPGMLGPSDVRKNIGRLMPHSDPAFKALATLSDHRLPINFPYAEGLAVVQAFAAKAADQQPEPMGRLFTMLRWDHTQQIGRWCQDFLAYAAEEESRGRKFDFHDCALGNIFFAGCYLSEKQDFNRTNAAFAAFHNARADLLNVTKGENLFLVAIKEDGSVLRNEGDIVSNQSMVKIRQIALMEASAYHGNFELGQGTQQEAEQHVLSHQVFPEINPVVDEAIRKADVIIYGPGTQHSSLFPSYLTRGLAEAIAANPEAEKIFVNNTRRDFDILDDDAGSIATRFMKCMSRYGEIAPTSKDLVTHFFLQQHTEDKRTTDNHVPFNADSFPFPESNLVLLDWETNEGHHAGGRVLEELQAIIQPKVEVVLESIHHMVSIIVPALNEERTIERVLKQLLAMDFTPFNLSKEIIVVDGGSNDRTAEIARTLPGIQVITHSSGGRGSALRAGIARVKGNIVLFFPADNEYSTSDIFPIVASFSRGGFKVVFGSRAIKCVNLNERISSIYGNNWLGYILSKYGGMLLSTTALLLYNRYVADPLTSVKAFDGRLLRSFTLKSSGVDLEMELFAKVSKRQQFILEVPVDYKPRSKKAGKKTTPWQGIKAFWALLFYRFSN